MKSLSGWPDVSIQRFWKASAMRRTRKPLPHGRQSRPAVRQKKSRTFPTGNALPSIDAFFKLGASFGAHPFSFIVKMERIRLSELSISGNVLGEALSERCPDSASRIKPKIRTLLPQEKGSDFLDLVWVVIQNFLKTPVISRACGHPNRKLSCISPCFRAAVLKQPPFY